MMKPKSNDGGSTNASGDENGDDDGGVASGGTATPFVGAYYYPWYGPRFHNGGGYLRRGLDPPQQPALGEYDDTKSDVIGQHLEWSRRANIRLWVTSWWGPNRAEDTTIRSAILGHPGLGTHRVALHYETTGRIRGKDDVGKNVRGDVQHMCEHYFGHPNYYRIGGRPVLVIYLSRKLYQDGLLEAVLLTMRTEAGRHGHILYLVGDQAFQDPPVVVPTAAAGGPSYYPPFSYLDAVTNYDVYGGCGRPAGFAGRERVDKYYAQQERWRELAATEGCSFVPSVSPGFNDRGVRLESDHPPLSRRLAQGAKEGSLLWYQLKRATPLVDHRLAGGLLLVNSFNEWHEDTQIEPAATAAVGGAGMATTSKPILLTKGLEYAAYGELYLDILAEGTSSSFTLPSAASALDADQRTRFDCHFAESSS